jgi:hypothetical protein
VASATRPARNVRIDLLPPSQVKVPDTEVGPVGQRQRFAQCWEEGLVDVVKDSWHSMHLVNVVYTCLSHIIARIAIAGYRQRSSLFPGVLSLFDSEVVGQYTAPRKRDGSRARGNFF